jgi:hypothetical protein
MAAKNEAMNEEKNEERNILSVEEATAMFNSRDDVYPIDVSALRKQQDQVGTITLVNRLANIPVRKPRKQEFFRTMDKPGHSLETRILEVNNTEHESYLIAPHLQPELEGEATPVILTPCINRQGELFLWPVKSYSADGRRNKWTESTLEAAKLAKSKWVRITANMNKGEYDVIVAEGDIPSPKWPEIAFDKLINIAFKGHYITDIDHEVLRELRGEI